MAKSLCVIHANCQGDDLAYILSRTPSFNRLFKVKKYTNYLKENIEPSDFSECRLFLYQHLSEKWDDHSSDILCSKFASAQKIKIPNMFFKGYWPLWTDKTFMNFGDIFLEHLIQKNLPIQEIVYLCVSSALGKMYDLDSIIKDSMEIERNKEADCLIKTTNIIEELWQKEQLFFTVNHPYPHLLLHVANSVLKLLELEKIPQYLCYSYTAEKIEDFYLPIYPQLGAILNLPFVFKERKYGIWGKEMIFSEYCQHYIHCHKQKDIPFDTYLYALNNKS